MFDQATKRVRQHRRQLRVRKRIHGTTERPRLAVHRSSKHIYAQIIDDSSGKTLAAASTVEPDVRSRVKSGGNKQAAARLLGLKRTTLVAKLRRRSTAPIQHLAS